MTIDIDIRSTVNDVTKDLTRLQRKQIPFARARALTYTAKDAQQSIRKAMQHTFDRPTRFTLNSTYVAPATKARPVAQVWLRGWAPKGTGGEKYLGPHVFSGKRKPKRSETLLMQKGLLTPGHFLVPAKGVKLDRYGNIPKGQLQKALSNIRAQHDINQRTPIGNKTAFFYGEIKGVRGIWKRQGKKLSAFMVEVKPPTYRKRLDMFRITDKVIDRRFRVHFIKSLEQAIRTAR